MAEAIQHFINGMAQVPPPLIYGFIVIWLALESCGLPLPNELVLLAAGSLAGTGLLSPVLLVIVATASSLLGATAAYEIGKRGGRAAVLRFGHYIRLDEQRLDAVERWFRRSGVLAIGLARITPFVRTVASFPAGMLQLSYRRFLIASTVGSLIWCTVMVTLGVVLGSNYTVALRLIEQYTLPAILVIALLFAGYLWLHNRLTHVGEGDGGNGDSVGSGKSGGTGD
jgi:membrane protein DedA with SNARE-associated domain